MYTKKMYSKIRQCRLSCTQGTFVLINWNRISPARLPLSECPSMEPRAGASSGEVPALRPRDHGLRPLHPHPAPLFGSRDLGGTTAQTAPANYNLIKLKRSFFLQKNEKPQLVFGRALDFARWAELISHSIDHKPCLWFRSHHHHQLCSLQCLWEGIIPNVIIALLGIANSVSQQEAKTAGLSSKILN